MVKNISKALLLAALLGAFWFSTAQVTKASGTCQFSNGQCVAVHCLQCELSGSNRCTCVQ